MSRDRKCKYCGCDISSLWFSIMYCCEGHEELHEHDIRKIRDYEEDRRAKKANEDRIYWSSPEGIALKERNRVIEERNKVINSNNAKIRRDREVNKITDYVVEIDHFIREYWSISSLYKLFIKKPIQSLKYIFANKSFSMLIDCFYSIKMFFTCLNLSTNAEAELNKIIKHQSSNWDYFTRTLLSEFNDFEVNVMDSVWRTIVIILSLVCPFFIMFFYFLIKIII